MKRPRTPLVLRYHPIMSTEYSIAEPPPSSSSSHKNVAFDNSQEKRIRQRNEKVIVRFLRTRRGRRRGRMSTTIVLSFSVLLLTNLRLSSNTDTVFNHQNVPHYFVSGMVFPSFSNNNQNNNFLNKNNNDKGVDLPTLRDWQVSSDGKLIGTVAGHPIVPDGEVLTTAPLLDPAKVIALQKQRQSKKRRNNNMEPTTIVTITGTQYQLLPPSMGSINPFLPSSRSQPSSFPPSGLSFSTDLPYRIQLAYLEEQLETIQQLAQLEEQQEAQAEQTSNLIKGGLAVAATLGTIGLLASNPRIENAVQQASHLTQRSFQTLQSSLQESWQATLETPKVVLPYLEEQIQALEEQLDEIQQQQQQQQQQTEDKKDDSPDPTLSSSPISTAAESTTITTAVPGVKESVENTQTSSVPNKQPSMLGTTNKDTDAADADAVIDKDLSKQDGKKEAGTVSSTESVSTASTVLEDRVESTKIGTVQESIPTDSGKTETTTTVAEIETTKDQAQLNSDSSSETKTKESTASTVAEEKSESTKIANLQESIPTDSGKTEATNTVAKMATTKDQAQPNSDSSSETKTKESTASTVAEEKVESTKIGVLQESEPANSGEKTETTTNVVAKMETTKDQAQPNSDRGSETKTVESNPSNPDASLLAKFKETKEDGKEVVKFEAVTIAGKTFSDMLQKGKDIFKGDEIAKLGSTVKEMETTGTQILAQTQGDGQEKTMSGLGEMALQVLGTDGVTSLCNRLSDLVASAKKVLGQEDALALDKILAELIQSTLKSVHDNAKAKIWNDDNQLTLMVAASIIGFAGISVASAALFQQTREQTDTEKHLNDEPKRDKGTLFQRLFGRAEANRKSTDSMIQKTSGSFPSKSQGNDVDPNNSSPFPFASTYGKNSTSSYASDDVTPRPKTPMPPNSGGVGNPTTNFGNPLSSKRPVPPTIPPTFPTSGPKEINSQFRSQPRAGIAAYPKNRPTPVGSPSNDKFESQQQNDPVEPAQNQTPTSFTSPFGSSSTSTNLSIDSTPNSPTKSASSPYGIVPDTSNSPFGANTPKPPMSPVGSVPKSPTSPFGTTPQTQGSPFSATSKSSTSPFGTNTPKSPVSPFGPIPKSPMSPFGTTPKTQGSSFNATAKSSTSPFGTNAPKSPVSPFGPIPKSPMSPFGTTPKTQGSTFSATAKSSTSPFGTNTPKSPMSPFESTFKSPTSPFGAKPTTQGAPLSATPKSSTSPFGANAPKQPESLTGSVPKQSFSPFGQAAKQSPTKPEFTSDSKTPSSPLEPMPDLYSEKEGGEKPASDDFAPFKRGPPSTPLVEENTASPFGASINPFGSSDRTAKVSPDQSVFGQPSSNFGAPSSLQQQSNFGAPPKGFKDAANTKAANEPVGSSYSSVSGPSSFSIKDGPQFNGSQGPNIPKSTSSGPNPTTFSTTNDSNGSTAFGYNSKLPASFGGGPPTNNGFSSGTNIPKPGGFGAGPFGPGTAQSTGGFPFSNGFGSPQVSKVPRESNGLGTPGQETPGSSNAEASSNFGAPMSTSTNSNRQFQSEFGPTTADNGSPSQNTLQGSSVSPSSPPVSRLRPKDSTAPQDDMYERMRLEFEMREEQRKQQQGNGPVNGSAGTFSSKSGINGNSSPPPSNPFASSSGAAGTTSIPKVDALSDMENLQRLADEARLEEEERLAQEKNRLVQEKEERERREADQARLAEERRIAEIKAKIAEEKARLEADRARLEEEKRKAEEALRKKQRQRIQKEEEDRQKAEERLRVQQQKKEEERARLEKLKQLGKEQARYEAEMKDKSEEEMKRGEEARLQQLRRLAQEQAQYEAEARGEIPRSQSSDFPKSPPEATQVEVLDESSTVKKSDIIDVKGFRLDEDGVIVEDIRNADVNGNQESSRQKLEEEARLRSQKFQAAQQRQAAEDRENTYRRSLEEQARPRAQLQEQQRKAQQQRAHEEKRRQLSEQLALEEEKARIMEERARLEEESKRRAEQLKIQQEQAKKQEAFNAIANTLAQADDAFVPSTQALENTKLMLQEVTGPVLDAKSFGKEGYFTGRNVQIYSGRTESVPIRVSVPGTFVEFTIDKKAYDFGLEIVAFLDNGQSVTIKRNAPFSKHSGRQNHYEDRLLIGAGSAPCQLQFRFHNTYRTLLEKVVLSYRIKVTSPPKELVLKGRRIRADACLRSVEEDLYKNREIMAKIAGQKEYLEEDIAKLQRTIMKKSKMVTTIQDEERRWGALLQKLKTGKVPKTSNARQQIVKNTPGKQRPRGSSDIKKSEGDSE
ncbi:hypothetical protein IV203_018786 [Nitzschia inconspicua]|uniref:Uncharacterized protein n=1 Tax=Nitzschia inconspicua TaxID=303405 RepID=A0A9K3Q6D3_9STRA|nr:hypothetical protein IV203_018786 [Nitzschia inconspicua]